MLIIEITSALKKIKNCILEKKENLDLGAIEYLYDIGIKLPDSYDGPISAEYYGENILQIYTLYAGRKKEQPSIVIDEKNLDIFGAKKYGHYIFYRKKSFVFIIHYKNDIGVKIIYNKPIESIGYYIYRDPLDKKIKEFGMLGKETVSLSLQNTIAQTLSYVDFFIKYLLTGMKYNKYYKYCQYRTVYLKVWPGNRSLRYIINL